MKLGQGDVACSRKKTVLGWEIDTKEHHLRLTPKRNLKVRMALDMIPAEAHQVSLRKLGHLLGLLRSIAPAVAGAQGMFTRLQHALQHPWGRRLQLSPPVQDAVACQRYQSLTDTPPQA